MEGPAPLAGQQPSALGKACQKKPLKLGSNPELPPARAVQAPSLTKPWNQGDQVLGWKLVYFCSCSSLFLEMSKKAPRDSIYQHLCRPLPLGKDIQRGHSLQAQLLLPAALAPAECCTSGLYSSLRWPTTAQHPPQPGEGKAGAHGQEQEVLEDRDEALPCHWQGLPGCRCQDVVASCKSWRSSLCGEHLSGSPTPQHREWPSPRESLGKGGQNSAQQPGLSQGNRATNTGERHRSSWMGSWQPVMVNAPYICGKHP